MPNSCALDVAIGASSYSVDTPLREVLTDDTKVVTALVDTSALVLSRMMIKHRVSCLIITDAFKSDDIAHSLLREGPNPVGLVTERELVQAQATAQNLERLSAGDLMTPFAVGLFSPKTSLGDACQALVEKDLKYGVISTGEALLGLVSQSSLLKLLNPIAIHAALKQTREQSDANAAELAEINAQLKKDLRKRKRVEEALKETLKTLQSAQVQAIQNERMAGLGHFVAGVAHEINNPVNFIHGNLKPAKAYAKELLLFVNHYRKTELSSAIQAEMDDMEEIDIEFLAEDFPRLLDSMESGTKRIREIVRSLRHFSRLDEAEMKPVDVHEGIENTLMLLPNRLKAEPGQSAISVIKSYDQLPLVECFVSQLNQAFWHLLSNAIDAVRIRHSQRRAAQESSEIATIEIRTKVLDDDWISICIADNGVGISEPDLAKIFDPFYTTKPVGQGTGLGLSICHQVVVEKHGGRLRCHSTPGQGTEFIVEIPCRVTV